jgi:hypothetical protein
LAAKLKAAQDAAAVAKQNIEQRAILKAEQQRQQQLAALQKLDRLLTQNLQAA